MPLREANSKGEEGNFQRERSKGVRGGGGEPGMMPRTRVEVREESRDPLNQRPRRRMEGGQVFIIRTLGRKSTHLTPNKKPSWENRLGLP